MGINEIVNGLIKKNGKSLIFVLGPEARDKVEGGLKSIDNNLSTIERSRHDIKILFLSKLQYLFMFLMKLEAEKKCNYSNIAMYGLDSLISEKSDTERIRLSNLILSTLYKVYRTHDLHDIVIEWFDNEKDNTELDRMVEYWKFLIA
ncbi:hypothetical protein C6P45_001960 [Maudiozyma exigua]|uniref:Uncharacterized protein n=1 Tax=Maudiozyma exigua TaxID=34358 RepID=A0A9P7BE17_MAUEX|nr:hypothetical protein C6P45_001960 [Kazachstania exigua]